MSAALVFSLAESGVFESGLRMLEKCRREREAWRMREIRDMVVFFGLGFGADGC